MINKIFLASTLALAFSCNNAKAKEDANKKEVKQEIKKEVYKNNTKVVGNSKKGSIVYRHNDIILAIKWEYKEELGNSSKFLTYYKHFVKYNPDDSSFEYVDFKNSVKQALKIDPDLEGFSSYIVNDLYESINRSRSYNFGKIEDEVSWKDNLVIEKKE